jgi:ELWxxDGT repeat protein
VADDGTHGRELMSLNPVDETKAVFDVTQGSSGSDPAKLFVLGDKLFFTVQSGGSTHVYSCDGSAAHEVSIACDLSYVDHFFVSGSTAYFAGYEVDTGLEPWVFDGSSARRLTDLNSGQAWSSPHAFIEHQGNVYFAADDGSGATSLWQVAGASVSKFFARATGSGSITHMLSLNNEIVFVSARVENDQVKRSLVHLSRAVLISSDSLPYEPTADWPLLAARSLILFSGAPSGSTEVKLYSWSISGYQAAGMAA